MSAPPGPPPDSRWQGRPVPAATRRPAPAHLDPRLSGLVRNGRSGGFGLIGGPFRRRGNESDQRGDAERLLSLPLPGPRRIGVIGLKGGVGKTTLSVLIGTALARARHDDVLLVDADTTFGSFLLRTGVTPLACAADLAVMGDPGRRDVLAGSLSRTRDGLWALPSGRNPTQSAAFGEASYVGAMKAVYRHFPLMVTDCGAGIASPLMYRVLAGCHSLVIATSPSLDGILATHNTLQWLASSGFEGLTQRTIVVLTNVPRKGLGLDLDEARTRLRAVSGAVATLPHDDHLGLGGYLDVDALAPATAAATRYIAGISLQATI